MTGSGGPTHLTTSATAVAEALPGWVTLVRADNPGPMTLDGTNTWLLRGPGAPGYLVIDPGPEDSAHVAAVAETGPIATLLLTHWHLDHDGATPLLRHVTGAAAPAQDADGAIREIAGLSVTVLETPGHTADSRCFLISTVAGDDPVIFTGDTILGRGTTVVAPPDGDLGAYLDSLERLSAYRGLRALPGHGPALADCGGAARFYLEHRRARLDQVRRVLAEGAGTADEVVARVYADVDRKLWPAAKMTVQSQLAYLARADGPP